MLIGSIDSQLNIGGNTYPVVPPSLNLDFINKNVIDSRITFTRSSSATYTDRDGYIKIATTDTPRIDYDANTGSCNGLLMEEQRSNLFTYSENFENIVWGYTGAFTIPNISVSPNGQYTAYKLVGSNGVSVRKSVAATPALTANTVYTFTVYMKAAERTTASMWFDSTNLVEGAYYGSSCTIDLAAGTVAIPGQVKLTNVGNGWYRCSLTATPTVSGATYMQISIGPPNGGDFTGNNSSGIYIWGAQIEAGRFPTSYIPSTQTFTSRSSIGTYVASNGYIQTASSNIARYNYNPINLALSPKLLLENSSTNLFANSNMFTGTSWSIGLATITTDSSIVSPDGGYNAYKLIADNSTAQHVMLQNIGTVAVGNTYTLSVFAKANSYSQISLTAHAEYYSAFNLANGTIIQAGNICSIVPYGNGWYRCSATITKTNTTGNFYILLWNNTNVFAGDGVSNLYIYGAQLEQANSASSYIPTTSTAVTRSADVYTSTSATRQQDSATMTGSNLNWYNPNQGTFVVTEQTFSNGRTSSGGFSYPGVIAIDRNSTGSADRVGMYFAPAVAPGYISTFWRVGGVQYGNNLTGTANNIPIIHSMSYGPSYVSISANGSNYQAGSTTSWPTLSDTFRIGQADSPLNGWIKNIRYYPRQLSNTEIQTLSSI